MAFFVNNSVSSCHPESQKVLSRAGLGHLCRLHPFRVSVRVEDQVEQTAGYAECQGSEKGVPETGDEKAGNEPGSQREKSGIDEKSEKTEGQHVDRQGEKKQKGAEKSVQQSEHQSGNGHGLPAVHADTRDDIHHYHEGHAVDQPPDKKSFHGLPSYGPVAKPLSTVRLFLYAEILTRCGRLSGIMLQMSSNPGAERESDRLQAREVSYD